MAQLRINGNVKIGGIYECDFGSYSSKLPQEIVTNEKNDADINNFNYNIPIEIIKKRPVVVIAKNKGLYTVVPISSSEEKSDQKNDLVVKGIHILMGTDFPKTPHYDSQIPRWAKSNLVSTVDGRRLTDIFCTNNRAFVPVHVVLPETLEKIRRGVLIHIGLSKLLKLLTAG